MHSHWLRDANIVQLVTLTANLLGSSFAATLAFSYAIFVEEPESTYVAAYMLLLPITWSFTVSCTACVCIVLTMLRARAGKEFTQAQVAAAVLFTNLIIPMPAFAVLMLLRG